MYNEDHTSFFLVPHCLMLTNWKTISQLIKRLRGLDEELAQESLGCTKKELLNRTRAARKTSAPSVGSRRWEGCRTSSSSSTPTRRRSPSPRRRNSAFPWSRSSTATRTRMPSTTRSPGNDSQRAIRIYCELYRWRAALDGLQEQLVKSGVDIGERAQAPIEQLPSAAEAGEGGRHPRQHSRLRQPRRRRRRRSSASTPVAAYSQIGKMKLSQELDDVCFCRGPFAFRRRKTKRQRPTLGRVLVDAVTHKIAFTVNHDRRITMRRG